MIQIFVALWTMLLFLSIAWYGFLLIYVGIKGAKEIKEMTKTLRERAARD